MKLTSSHDPSKTLNAKNMETLIEGPSEGDLKEAHGLASCDGEDNICQLIEVKKRKKRLSWPSLMRRLSHLSDFSEVSTPELRTSIFDQPLSVICGENGSLPRPIQDILTVLCLKGPSTEGIFRKAANEKARKELKEELNSGGAVELQSQPVHLLAVVFKDFLRSIPQKLLSCNLFEEWMGALEKQNEEDKIEALKQVAEKLPRPNLLLLKHLVYVLYLISKNSETNKMDASNLAICIGPNILAPENDQNLSFEAQKDLNNKVKSLLEFLIDNCIEIFGENIPAHSSITSDDSLEHTDSSDTSTQHNDSAYDSNDPDVDVGSTLDFPSKQHQAPADEASSWEAQSTEQQAYAPGWEPLVSSVSRLRDSLGLSKRSYSDPSISCCPRDPEGRRPSPQLAKLAQDLPGTRASSHSYNEYPEDPFIEEEEEEVFPGPEGKAQPLQDPNVMQPARLQASACRLGPQATSRGSLDASSEGSPEVSPSSPKRNFFTRHQSFTKWEKRKPHRELKKHSLSFSFPSPPRAQALGSSSLRCKGFPREQVQKGAKKEARLAGRLVQENLWDMPGHMAPDTSWQHGSTLETDAVFQLVDQWRAGRPPSYQEAIHCQASTLTACGSKTVGSMRAQMHRQNAGYLTSLPAHHGGKALDEHLDCPKTGSWKLNGIVCASADTTEPGTVSWRPELHILKTISNPKKQRDPLMWRSSQPVFEAEQLENAKESYI